jgi:rubrerythrin
LGPATNDFDPDLIFLRNAVARETEAFLDYRAHGMTVADRRLADVFHHESSHEAGHFIELNRMISRLDPVQATEFADHGLSYLAGTALEGKPGRRESLRKSRDPEEWIDALKHSIQLELNTLNAYQMDAARAAHPEVRELLTEIANHEKEDYAIFTRELQRLLHDEG